MKLGLMTAAFPTLSLEEVAEWSASNGFETLEIASWPAAPDGSRRQSRSRQPPATWPCSR